MSKIFLFLIIVTATQALNLLEGCDSPSCLNEVKRINAQIDPKINPCDDFYRFSCGKFLETATNDEIPGKFEQLEEKSKKETLELYKRSINSEDHKIGQAEKKLFHACMDLPKIEEDNLKTLKNVLNFVGGGWPLVVGDKWDETKFDWLEATYKLRALGYPYSIFVDLELDEHPQDQTHSSLKVQIPSKYRGPIYKRVSEHTETIEKIVRAFGEDQHNLSNDLAILIEFEDQLIEKSMKHRRFEFSAYTVEEFQKIIGSVSWLNFINNISAPAATISSDFVLTVKEKILGQWLEVIKKASKRTQANFLMWKVVEEMIPYLTSELRNLALSLDELKVPREEFCLNITQERFTPSAINIMQSRNLLEIKPQVEKMVWNIRDALLNKLNNSWLGKYLLDSVAEKLRTMVLVIGEPINSNAKSLDLDELIMDMKETSNENLLNLLSQANRNHISLIFSRLKKTNRDQQLNDWYTKPSSSKIEFNTEASVLSIPVAQLIDPVFNPHRPNYLNYAILGKEIGKYMTDLMLNKYLNSDFGSAQRFYNIMTCLIEDIQIFQKLITGDQAVEMASNIVGAKLAYGAYQNWAKSNEKEEVQVNGMNNYTIEQLFWISTADCKYFPAIPPPDYLEGVYLGEYHLKMSVYRDFPRTLVSSVMRNVPDFSKDFGCSLGSPLNPSNRCKVF